LIVGVCGLTDETQDIWLGAAGALADAKAADGQQRMLEGLSGAWTP
jgi:hypothetical protein